MTKSITFSYMLALATVVALVASMFAYAAPASADNIDNDVRISVTNSGNIDSHTRAEADTGGNTAAGSYGGDGDDGGDGGSVSGNESGNTAGDGGAGGAGGDGGDGGWVETGDANAEAGSLNVLNTTRADVTASDCGCDDLDNGQWDNVDNDLRVSVSNSGNIDSRTKARSSTGNNSAGGSTGGDGDDGGDGGDATGNESGNTAGDGGAGGDGGMGGVGGTVMTGGSSSTAASLNILNTTLIRVR